MNIEKYKNVKIIEDLDDKYCIVQCKDFKFKIRKNKIDAFTVNEVAYKSGYFGFLDLNKNDVVLDIGCHIGTFMVIASKLCKNVISFEPDKENYELALFNKELNNCDNATIINSAVSTQSGEIDLYLNSGVCTDCHSTFPVKGRKVVKIQSSNIKDLIEIYKPNKIKIDCEGEELNILRLADLSTIEKLIAEVHFFISIKDGHSRFYQMRDNIEKYFNKIKYPPTIPDKYARIIKMEKL